ncbi:CdaR family transcriptional regulator [Paenibacillus sp. sgz302251]|uniref:CdaR family transcriptional regulator n=1 Tax=Paenibacillus sp. sgz302251 TaxID=3414493 RepID=UPI003C7CF8C3
MLTRQLAEEIVAQTMHRVNWNINVIDVDGSIIASGDTSRVGEYHQAAGAAIKHNRTLIIRQDQLHKWRGAQVGVNMPVHYNQQVIGAIGITGNPEEVEPFSQLVNMTAELLIRQHYSKLQEEWKQMTCDMIIEALLQEPSTEASDVVNAKLEMIRHSLRPPFQMAIASFTHTSHTRIEESVPLKVRRMLEGSHVLISQSRPQRLLLLFSETTSQGVTCKLDKLAGLLHVETNAYRIGVGTFVSSRSEIRRSFQEAESALSCGSRSQGQVVHFNDIEGQALIQYIPEEHRTRLEEKLLPFWNSKIEETLQCFFDCSFNLASAANRLGIHRNTLIYRLEKVKDTTGYDPACFRDAMILQMVIWRNG